MQKIKSCKNKRELFSYISSVYRDERQKILEVNELTLGGITMKFTWKICGSKPEEGFPLYIGLHGGGGCDKDVNDEQWENHKNLYDIECGIWFTPRAPEDCWNMWHKSYIDDMLDYIIQTFLMLEWVDPNLVYLTGYSAGGDGVYKLGPRMADRWAGCAMCAGHPNGAEVINLRNTFMALQVGAQDSPYDRNKLCLQYGDKIDALKQNDPNGYDYFCKVHEGCGHWMNKKESVFLDMFNSKIRNPYPKYIIWKQCNDVLKSNFYWLEIPKDKQNYGSQVEANIENNFINITTKDYDEVIVNLNEKLIDYNRDIQVKFNNSQIFQQRVFEDINLMVKSVERRFDPYLVFGTRFSISMKGIGNPRD